MMRWLCGLLGSGEHADQEAAGVRQGRPAVADDLSARVCGAALLALAAHAAAEARHAGVPVAVIR